MFLRSSSLSLRKQSPTLIVSFRNLNGFIAYFTYDLNGSVHRDDSLLKKEKDHRLKNRSICNGINTVSVKHGPTKSHTFPVKNVHGSLYIWSERIIK